MIGKKLRRLAVLTLVVTLAAAVAAQGFGGANARAAMTIETAAAEMPMPGGCDGCPGDNPGPPACAAFCSSAFALLPPMQTGGLGMVATAAHSSRPNPVLAGRSDPPELHPPNSALPA